MSLRSRNLFHVTSALAIVLSSTLALSAAEKKTSTPPNSADAPIPVASAPDFGTSAFEVVTVSAYDFHEWRLAGAITGVNDDENGFSWATGGTNKLFVASFQVPAGAVIDSYGLRYCDTTATSNFYGALYDIVGDGSFNFISQANFPDAACGTMYSPAGANYLWSGNSGHSLDLYVFQIGPDVAGEVKFRGAEVRFKRTVSPAPLVATFPDVPTGDFGFQYIEALAASGITGGCGGGLFCPDGNVTRRQMAIFIAKALALNYSN
jgi:hypothetical protein